MATMAAEEAGVSFEKRKLLSAGDKSYSVESFCKGECILY